MKLRQAKKLRLWLNNHFVQLYRCFRFCPICPVQRRYTTWGWLSLGDSVRPPSRHGSLSVSLIPDVVPFDGLPPQDPEVLRPAHHEPRELAAQHLLYLVRLCLQRHLRDHFLNLHSRADFWKGVSFHVPGSFPTRPSWWTHHHEILT